MSDTTPPKPDGLMSEDSFRALCLMYHAQDIDEAGFAALSAELDRDARRRALFVEVATQVETVYEAFELKDAEQTAVELGITAEDEVGEEEDAFDLMNMVVDQALALRRQHELEDEANGLLAQQQAASAQERRYRLAASGPAAAGQRGIQIPLPLVIGAVAAMLLLIVYLFSPTSTKPPTDSDATAQAPPASPTVRERFGEWVAPIPPVAGIVNTHQPQWGMAEPDGEPTHYPGTDGRMTPGRYALASGAVELRLDGGAVLLVEGPAEFILTDDHSGALRSGRLVADTTSAPAAFEFETPTASVRGLSGGGRFGLAVDSAGQTSAHVYAGRMDFTNMAPAGRATTVRLTASQGAVVELADTAPRREPVAAEQFALQMAALSGKPVVTGEADYHNHMPASVVMNRGPQSPRAWVALESTGRPLQRGTAWAQSYPSRPSMLIDTEGRVVDSYLVMFDPADETTRFKTAEFTLTFPGEVLTLITEDADLAQSHDWYGDPRVQYDYQGLITDGLEGGLVEQRSDSFVPDSIEQSEDGRTMRVFLGAHNGADVFRVLVVRPARTGELPVVVPAQAPVFPDVFRRGSVCPAYLDFGPMVGVEPIRGISAAMSSLKGEI